MNPYNAGCALFHWANIFFARFISSRAAKKSPHMLYTSTNRSFDISCYVTLRINYQKDLKRTQIDEFMYILLIKSKIFSIFLQFNALITKIIYLTQLLLISLIALNETKLIRSVSRSSHMFHTLADILIKQISLVVYSDNTSCSVLLLQKFQPKKNRNILRRVSDDFQPTNTVCFNAVARRGFN